MNVISMKYRRDSRSALPLLYLWGAKDQYQPLSSAERFIADFPEAQLRVISDSDHFLPLENGEEMAQIIIEFFR
jgi:pimeloyl-ACP methyl ester carboxylesterase